MLPSQALSLCSIHGLVSCSKAGGRGGHWWISYFVFTLSPHREGHQTWHRHAHADRVQYCWSQAGEKLFSVLYSKFGDRRKKEWKKPESSASESENLGGKLISTHLLEYSSISEIFQIDDKFDYN